MTITMQPAIRDAIIKAIPTDASVSLQQIAADARCSEQTARSYVAQLRKDGWLEVNTSVSPGGRTRGTAVRRLWADTFFEARPLLEMIEFDNGIIAGPFCENCGWPFTHHGGTRSRCPAKVHPLLGGRNA